MTVTEIYVVKAVSEAAAMVDITGLFIGLIVWLVVLMIVWKAIRIGMTRNDYRNAYYIAKLKKHATKQGINLDEEMEKLERPLFSNKRENEKNKDEEILYGDDIANTDILFKELEKKEKAQVKKGK